MINIQRLQSFLEHRFEKICSQDFITEDPICIPHKFSQKQDIEIAGFIASMFAFGKRSILIAKAQKIMHLMDNSPYDFVKNATDNDFKKFISFKHRTINEDDIIYVIQFFQRFYKVNDSLETLFSKYLTRTDLNTEQSLIEAHNIFFKEVSENFRTKRHFPSPEKGSACKRINMFLRWMVRKDKNNIDFGIWNNISPSQLICPCDVHVLNIAYDLKLISQKKANWKTAIELTNNLKLMNAKDPLKYDFALFGSGVYKMGLL